MSVTGVSYCDFMVWTPSGFVVLRIEPDTTFIENVLNKYDVFWNWFILRELAFNIIMVQSTTFLLSNQGFLVFHFQFSFEKIYLDQTPKKRFTTPMLRS